MEENPPQTQGKTPSVRGRSFQLKSATFASNCSASFIGFSFFCRPSAPSALVHRSPGRVRRASPPGGDAPPSQEAQTEMKSSISGTGGVSVSAGQEPR